MSQYLNLKRIEFIVTYRCNSHCKHCHVEAAKRVSRPRALTPELAERAVRELAGAYTLSYVMTFGGEPLLFPRTVCAVHAIARECGIPGRSIITNAGFPVGEAEFREVAQSLVESGVNGICISVDAFHQEYIPLAVVRQNVRLLAEAGIEELKWNPCWVVSRDHDNPWNARTRLVLEELADLPVQPDDGDVTLLPEGQALVYLAEYLPPRQDLPVGTCGDKPYTGRLDEIISITVEPDGSLTICDENMSIGSMGQRDAAEICQAYDPYQMPIHRAILEGGLAGLAEMAHQRGIQPDPAGYYSVCGMCKALRRELVTG